MKHLRKRLDLTQIDAAREINLSYKALQDHEGGRLPNKNNLQKYLDFYKCNKIWLLTGEGEPPQGDDKGDVLVKETGLRYNVDRPVTDIGWQYNADPFGQASSALKEIFDSHDPVLIDAVRANLYISRLYVRKERQIQQQSDEIRELKKEIDTLKKRLDSLEKRDVGNAGAGSGSHVPTEAATREKES